MIIVGLNLVFLLLLLSTTNNIRAKEEKTSKITTKMSSVTIDQNTPFPFEVPMDAVGKVENALPNDYVQAKGVKPNFKKIELNSYSTTSGDTMEVKGNRYIQQLNEEGDYLLVSSSRNDGDMGKSDSPPALYTLNILKLNKNGKILDQKNIQTGMPYNPFNTTDTFLSGLHSANASPIIPYGNQRYGIIYTGRGAGLFEERRLVVIENKSTTFDIVHRSTISSSFTQSIEAVRPLWGGTKFLAYGFWERRTDDPDHPPAPEPQSLEVYEFNTILNTYTKLVDLQHEKISTILTPMTAYYGTELVDLRDTGDGYFGKVRYYNQYAPKNYKIFFYKWNYSGQLLSQRIDHHTTDSVILHEISNQERIYYYRHEPDATVLYQLDTSTYAVKEIKKYPINTSFKLQMQKQPNSDGIKYVFYGSVWQPKIGEFAPWNLEPGVVLAYLDDDFNVINATGILVEDGMPVNFSEIDTLDAEGNLFVAGNTQSKTFSKPPIGSGWVTKVGTESISNIFFGAMKKIDDYPPGIKFNDKLIVKMDEPSIDWDQALLSDVEAYDTFDIGDNLNGEQAKLQATINRNPNAPTNPIDWKGLGLNKTETGPQWIKYFIKDSSNQVTAASRLLNGVDENTDYDKTNPENFLSAGNFGIDIKDVTSLDRLSAKSAAALKAWHTESKGILIDDGTASKDVAKVNQTELQAIKDAKVTYDTAITAEEKSKIIRPYPLTFTYEDRTVQVTVFVTDDTTKIENNMVIYGFDFEASIKKVKNITSDEVKSLAYASAWDYQMKWGATALPVSNLTVDLSFTDPDKSLTGLNLVTEANESYKVKFDYQDSTGKKATNHLPSASIYGSPAKLNIRHVVLDSQADLVIPTTGYLVGENQDTTGKVASNVNLKTPILTDDTDQTFVLKQLELTFDHWCYQMRPIVPEYYQYEGYVASTKDPATNKQHEAKDKGIPTTLPILDYQTEEEYWLTIYLKPLTTDAPRPYSWDYLKQKMGDFAP